MPAIRGSKSNRKTRRHRRDLDQIHRDLADPKQLTAHKDSHAAEDLPALGEFYCVPCAKWFESKDNMQKHTKGKPHKRRLRQLKEEPYTQREAEAAVGLATDNGRPEEMAIDEPSSPDPAIITPLPPVPDQPQQGPSPFSAAASNGSMTYLHHNQNGDDDYDDKDEYDAFFKVY